MADDVRVKLSAEGLTEVVSALKSIREQAKQTGEEGSKSFEGFKEAIGEAGKEMVGFLAIGAIIEKTKELFGEVMNGAVSLNKLNQTTGVSTDMLQSLGMAAKETSVDQDKLNKGIEFFSRTLGAAENGSKKAAQGFSLLGISVKELKEMTPDQQFQLVAQKLGSIDDASRRAAIGAQIFGRGFQEIEPAIEKVSEEGVGKFIDKLKQLGVYLDQDTIRQMKAAKVAAGEVGEELKGLATQFLTGLMPAVTEAMDSFTKSVSGEQGAVGGMKKLGQVVGAVAVTIETVFEELGMTVGGMIAQWEIRIDSLMSATKRAAKGDFKGVGDEFKDASEKIRAIEEDMNKRDDQFAEKIKNAWGVVFGTVKQESSVEDSKDKKPGGDAGPDVNSIALAKARLALLEASAAAEKKIRDAALAAAEESNRAEYDEGLISLQEYYNNRRSIMQQKMEAEMTYLQAKRDAIAKMPIDINDDGTQALQKKAQLAQLDADIQARRIQSATELASINRQESADAIKINDQQLSAQAKILEIEGKKTEAAKIQLKLEQEKLKLELQKSGKSQSEIDAAINKAGEQGNAKIDYTAAKAEADAMMRSLDTQIAAIRAQVKDGSLFPAQAEQQIIDLEKQRLIGLQEQSDKMTELAKATGNAQDIAAAEAYNQKLKDIAASTDEVAMQMGKVKQAGEQAFESGLSNAIEGMAKGTENVSQAFRKMAASIAETLLKIETDFLSKQFVKWMENGAQSMGGGASSGASAASGAAGAASSATTTASTTANTTAVTANTAAESASTAAVGALAASMASNSAALIENTAAVTASAASSGASAGASAAGGAAAAFAADGGHITGPGTSRSDSIPAMLSDGEFVVNASSTSKPGMLALLHAINGTPGYSGAQSSGVRKYAEGGAVSGAGMVHNTYRVDASDIPQHVVHQAVSSAVLDIIAKNPMKVRSSIGG